MNKKISNNKLVEIMHKSNLVNRLICINVIEDLGSRGHYAKGVAEWLKQDLLKEYYGNR